MCYNIHLHYQRLTQGVTSNMRKSKYWFEYLDYLRSKQCSENTIVTRDRTLKKFHRWMNSKNFHVQDIIESDIQEFKQSLELSPSTVSTHLTGLKAFYNWLFDNALIMIDPTAELIAHSNTQKLPQILLDAEISQLFDSLPSDTKTAKRNRAILELTYSSLLRRSEVVNIKLSDINLRTRTLRVKRKGKVEALLPFGKNAQRAVRDYLGARESESEYLFPISYLTIDGIFKQIRKDTGLQISMHTLRRSGATAMLKNGASLVVIQEMLSHSNLQAVKHYLRLDTKDLHQTLSKSELLK